MPAIALTILAFLLCACAATDPLVSTSRAIPAGNWRIERQADRVTGGPLSSALLATSNSSHSGSLFTRPALLQLICFKDQPMVRLAFQFKVGSNRNSVLGYRFDDKPGHDTNARFLQDYTTVVIEEKADVTQFVNELATSKVLYVRIRSLNAGRTSAEFRLDGAPAAIEAAFSDCPVTSDQPRKRKSA